MDKMTWKRLTVSFLCAIVILLLWTVGSSWAITAKVALTLICAVIGVACWWLEWDNKNNE